MTVLLLVVALLFPSLTPPLPPAPLARQSSVIIGPTDALGFDYLDADMLTFVVTHFEVQWDAGAFALFQPTPVMLPDTPLGATTYRFLPPFQSGTHTVVVRACRLEGCGGGSSPFDFAYPVAAPAVPSNIRKVPRV